MFSLAIGGKKPFLQNFAHVNLATTQFKDFFGQGTNLFKKDKSFIVERMHLYSSSKNDREVLKWFFLRLLGQAAQCGWSIQTEMEVVGDLFITKMRLKDIQRELCIRPGDSTLEIWDEPCYKKRGTSPLRFYKKKGNNSSTNPLSAQNCFKIKQEPTLPIQKKNNLQNRISRAQITKILMTQGKTEDLNHATFVAIVIHQIIVNHAQKKNISCNSRKNVDNIDEESEDTTEEEGDFITSDSESATDQVCQKIRSNQHKFG